jgi:hypothetical protein
MQREYKPINSVYGWDKLSEALEADCHGGRA